MKKRLLAILMATAMSMSLIACGGGEEEAATKEVATEEAVEEEAAVEEVADVEYTEEQQAFVDEYLQLCEDYDAAIVVFTVGIISSVGIIIPLSFIQQYQSYVFHMID